MGLEYQLRKRENAEFVKRLNAGGPMDSVAMNGLPKWTREGGRVSHQLPQTRAAEVRFFQTSSSTEAHPNCEQ